jgi:DNA processing protein
MDQNRLSLLALHFIPGIGDYMIRQLVSYCGSAENVFHTPKGKLQRIPGIGHITAAGIHSARPFAAAETEILKANKEGARITFYLDDDYPSRLKAINDAPSLLYIKGNTDLNASKAVAIVGTRNSTDYGKHCVEELVAGLSPWQPLIISGLAYGIDIQAHKQALRNNQQTVGVMGSGIDVIYPATHAEVVRKMTSYGGIVTENPLGTKPDAHHFPARNRIIAGLCDALIVVEAAQRGGALITADIANSYNKDVFAFPGNIGRSYSEGCNNLIKSNKAILVTSASDIVYAMNWDVVEPESKKSFSIALDEYPPEEQTILKLLMDNDQMMIDELSWRSSLSVSKLASLLLTLEFKGRVASLPGKVYKLIKP